MRAAQIDFHMTLSRAHGTHFSQLEIRKEKGESGKALKKREFTPESANVDTYGNSGL